MKNTTTKKQQTQYPFEVHLKAAVDHYWTKDNSCALRTPGEITCEERMTNALKEFLSRNIISSEENCLKIVTEGKYIHLYECGIKSFVDLREEILRDAYLYIDTKNDFNFLDYNIDEEILKEHLTLDGWFISNGMAIKLNDDILSLAFIKCRDKILELGKEVERKKEEFTSAKTSYLSAFI